MARTLPCGAAPRAPRSASTAPVLRLPATCGTTESSTSSRPATTARAIPVETSPSGVTSRSLFGLVHSRLAAFRRCAPQVPCPAWSPSTPSATMLLPVRQPHPLCRLFTANSVQETWVASMATTSALPRAWPVLLRHDLMSIMR